MEGQETLFTSTDIENKLDEGSMLNNLKEVQFRNKLKQSTAFEHGI